MVLVCNDNDKNADFVGGIGVGTDSNRGPIQVQQGWLVVKVALNNGEVAIIGDSIGAIQ